MRVSLAHSEHCECTARTHAAVQQHSALRALAQHAGTHRAATQRAHRAATQCARNHAHLHHPRPQLVRHHHKSHKNHIPYLNPTLLRVLDDAATWTVRALEQDRPNACRCWSIFGLNGNVMWFLMFIFRNEAVLWSRAWFCGELKKSGVTRASYTALYSIPTDAKQPLQHIYTHKGHTRLVDPLNRPVHLSRCLLMT